MQFSPADPESIKWSSANFRSTAERTTKISAQLKKNIFVRSELLIVQNIDFPNPLRPVRYWRSEWTPDQLEKLRHEPNSRNNKLIEKSSSGAH